MKKLIAILLAVAMIMGLAVVASADVNPTLDCPGWWGAHSEGIEITENLTTITFTNTTYEAATDNWCGPLVVLYTGAAPAVGCDGYTEYWVHRCDNWGWGKGVTYWESSADAMAAAGVSVVAEFADGCWDNFLADLKAGEEFTVTTQLDGNGNAVVSFAGHGIKNTITIAVDTTAPVYLSLTGQDTTLSNITVSVDSNDDTTTGGDDTTDGDDTTTGGDDTTTGGDDTTTGGDDTTTGGDDTTTEDKEEAPVVKDPYTLPDLDCTGWWAAHSEGIELDEAGVQITFKSSTYESASSNWNGPLWVLYTGSEAKVNGAGYLEYWVHRLDNFGWGNNGYYKVDLQPNAEGNTAFDTSCPDNLAAAGIKHEATFAEGFVWEELVANLKAGIDVTVFAQLVGKNAVITMTGAGITNTMTIPVDTSKPVYLSLSGDLNTITDIDVIPQTGDTTNLIALGAAMVLAVAGVAAITVGKKKFF